MTFNITFQYPELLLGLLYRSMNSMALLAKHCFMVNRGEGLSPVQSCEGLGDLPNFYVNGVWASAGLTTAFLFLIAVEASGSALGGVIATAFFFFNHGECTRVQWTPPLRESFAFPACLLQMLVVILHLRSNKPRRRKSGEGEEEEETGKRKQVRAKRFFHLCAVQFNSFPIR